MLINVAPSVEMSGEALFIEILIFIVVYNSVLLCRSWEVVVHYAELDKAVVLVLYGAVILFIVIGIIYLWTKKKKVKCCGEICEWFWDQLGFASGFIFLILPSMQFAIVFFAFGAARGGYYISIAVPVFYFLSFSCLFKLHKGMKSRLELLNKTAWIIYMFLMNTAMTLFYIAILAFKGDEAGWVCMAVFQQVLWMIPIFAFMSNNGERKGFCIFKSDVTKQTLYVFGSVGVVLLNSATLITELMLKTVNGERSVGDLRVVVFSSESVFAYSLLIFFMFGPDMKCLQYFQEAAKSCGIKVIRSDLNQDSQKAAGSPANESSQNQKMVEPHEMKPLLKTEDQEAGMRDMTETDTESQT